MHYAKPKSVAKSMISRGPKLQKIILDTLKACSDIVGSTLGPGGMSVVIERQEVDLPPIVTKDGVTVFRSLGFEDPQAQLIFEAARDAAVRTASEAGDGPQPLWSKVLTPSGFVEMGDVKVGMKICGTNGSVQKVLGVFPKGLKQITKVTFEGGQVVECCEDHLWVVTTNSGNVKTLPVKELIKDYNTLSDFYKYSVPKGYVVFDAERIHNFYEYKEKEQIVKIERTNSFTEMQCIEVSNPDHLYVTDDFIITHNTTTATILAESFARNISKFCNENPHISPQEVVRIIQNIFEKEILPIIQSRAIKAELGTEEGNEFLHSVAKISANGDTDLADAVMRCFDIIGDAGNVTIVENNGPSGYSVEKIEGYPIQTGFEDCCGPFYQKFVNDPGTQMCVLENPVFIVYNGRITDFNSLFLTLGTIANATSDSLRLTNEGTVKSPSEENFEGETSHKITHNVVVVANGFSETVLANFAAGFNVKGMINVFPVTAPLSPIKTGQYDFLMDVAALTGASILDPINLPFQNFELKHLGVGPRVFESSRFRSSIIGYRDEFLVMERVDQISKQLGDIAISELEKTLLRERVAKLTSGIAKLIVSGSSHGEIKEKRDRAEDAVCAVRGAIKHGCLPGGGAMLAELADVFMGESRDDKRKKISEEIMCTSLTEPIYRLYGNAGFSQDEIEDMVQSLEFNNVFDVLKGGYVDPLEAGVLDSVPAVLEAIRSAISIASSLGTCGGIVAFKRDRDVDLSEARDTAEWLRSANVNEADLRP